MPGHTPLARGVPTVALLRRRMGSGGLRGLQNRCFGAEASKGWFDSDTPPPIRFWILDFGLNNDSRRARAQSKIQNPKFTWGGRSGIPLSVRRPRALHPSLAPRLRTPADPRR